MSDHFMNGKPNRVDSLLCAVLLVACFPLSVFSQTAAPSVAAAATLAAVAPPPAGTLDVQTAIARLKSDLKNPTPSLSGWTVTAATLPGELAQQLSPLVPVELVAGHLTKVKI